MARNKINVAFDLINQAHLNDKVTSYGKVLTILIDHAEALLGIHLPSSYKYFLESHGFFMFAGFEVYGIITNDQEILKKTGVVWSVLEDREKFKIPNHIILISDLGDGSYYALDVSQMNAEGECPVVFWPLDGYEATPKLEIVAKDFGTFFLNMIQDKIADKKKSTEA